MKCVLLLTFLFSVSLCMGSPTETSVLVRERREFDLNENSRLIIQELIANLRNAIQQAVTTMTTFSSSLQDFSTQFLEKLRDDVGKFKDRLIESITNVTDKFTGIGPGVRECINEHRQEAEKIVGSILVDAKLCADNRINEIGQMIIRLKNMTVNATDYVSNSLEEMHNCTHGSDGILSTGVCLGRIAIRAEVKGAVFLAQSGFLITRINLALATLPSSLEICAGTSVVEAGIKAAKVVVEIGGCSATSTYTLLTGSVN